MKITKTQLQQIVQEELSGVLQEQGLVNEINIFGFEPYEGYLPGSADTYLDALTTAGAGLGGLVGMGGGPVGTIGGATLGGMGARKLGRAAMDKLGIRPNRPISTPPYFPETDGTSDYIPEIDDVSPVDPTPPPGFDPSKHDRAMQKPAPQPTPAPEPAAAAPQTFGRRGFKQAVRGAAGLQRGQGSLSRAQRQAMRQAFRAAPTAPTATAGRELRQLDPGAAAAAAGAGLTGGQQRRLDRLQAKAGQPPARRDYMEEDLYEEIYEAVIRELGK